MKDKFAKPENNTIDIPILQSAIVADTELTAIGVEVSEAIDVQSGNVEALVNGTSEIQETYNPILNTVDATVVYSVLDEAFEHEMAMISRLYDLAIMAEVARMAVAQNELINQNKGAIMGASRLYQCYETFAINRDLDWFSSAAVLKTLSGKYPDGIWDRSSFYTFYSKFRWGMLPNAWDMAANQFEKYGLPELKIYVTAYNRHGSLLIERDIVVNNLRSSKELILNGRLSSDEVKASMLNNLNFLRTWILYFTVNDCND